MKLEEDIIRIVCNSFSVSEEDILGTSRKREIVYARATVAYFLRNMLLYSLWKTGSRINKDHSTVVHYMHLVDKLLEIDYDYSSKFRKIQIKYERFQKLRLK